MATSASLPSKKKKSSSLKNTSSNAFQARGIWVLGGILFLYEQWVVLNSAQWVFITSLVILLGCALRLPKSFFHYTPIRKPLLNVSIVGFALANATWFLVLSQNSFLSWLLCLLCFLGSLLFLWPLATWLYKPPSKGTSWQSISAFLSSRRFLFVMLVLALILWGFLLREAFSLDLWIDEAFSMEMISKSFWEILVLTAKDVHPPLFYWYLKIGVSLLTTIFPGINPIFAARLFCELPYLGVIITCLWKVVPRFGNFVGGLCLFSLFGMPQIVHYSIEIRMYGLSMLWVLNAFLALYDLATLSKNHSKSWNGLILYSLLAAYTHYYAALAVGFGWLSLLWWLYKKHSTKAIKHWIRALEICVVGYLPWLIVFFLQLKTVKESYWIPAIDLSNLPAYFEYAYGRSLLWVLLVLVLCHFDKPIKSKELVWFIMSCLSLPIFVILFGFIVSIVFRPIYIERYVFCALFVFWMGIFITVNLRQNSKLRILFVGACLLLGLGRFSTEIELMRYNRIGAQTLSEAIQTTIGSSSEDVIVVCGNSHLWRNLYVILDEDFYLQKGLETQEPITIEVYGEPKIIGADYKLEDMIKEGKKVFLLGTKKELQAFEENASFKLTELRKDDNFGTSLGDVGIYKLTLASENSQPETENQEESNSQKENATSSNETSDTSSSSSMSSS